MLIASVALGNTVGTNVERAARLSVGRVVALGVAATACWISGIWIRRLPPLLRLAGADGGNVASEVSAGAALVGMGKAVALGGSTGAGGTVGLGAGSVADATVCAGALTCPEPLPCVDSKGVEEAGAAGATTANIVGVRVGVAETVGVAVMIRATYGVVVAGGAAAGGNVAVGVAVGVGVRLAVDVGLAGGQISANVRSGGWAPFWIELSPQAQP